MFAGVVQNIRNLQKELHKSDRIEGAADESQNPLGTVNLQ